MSVKVMSLVWEAEGLAATDRLLLLALADHANDEGECYPSVGRLVRRTGLSERTVQNAFIRLVAAGWLAIEAGAGPRGCNRFTVLPPQQMHPRSRCTPADDDVKPPQQMHPNRNRTINKASHGFSGKRPSRRASPEDADLFTAQAIRDGKRFLLSRVSAAKATSLVERGLVTADECKRAGVL